MIESSHCIHTTGTCMRRRVHKVQQPPIKPPTAIISQPIERRVKFDLEITEFEVQVAMSASMMLFSMTMLVTKRGEPGVYLPVITSIIGYWSPSPTKK